MFRRTWRMLRGGIGGLLVGFLLPPLVLVDVGVLTVIVMCSPGLPQGERAAGGSQADRPERTARQGEDLAQQDWETARGRVRRHVSIGLMANDSKTWIMRGRGRVSGAAVVMTVTCRCFVHDGEKERNEWMPGF